MSVLANPSLTGTLAERPAAGEPGRTYFATDNTTLYYDNGSAWVTTVPVSAVSVALAVPARQTVAGSPLTGSGTLTVTDNTQTANKVFAGPASGGAAAPTFRLLAEADLPVPIIPATTGAPVDAPAAGTVRFDSTAGKLYVYTGSAWLGIVLT